MDDELAKRLDAQDALLRSVREAQQTIVNQQLTLAQADVQLRAAVDSMGGAVREVRQTVGLSLPPNGEQGTAERMATWHLRRGFRLALTAASGAGGALLLDWLAKLLARGG